MKSFITSFARCKTARTIVDNNLIDNVIRIHTDSVCLSKPFDFTRYNNELIPETKTTGKFEFININNYVRIDYIFFKSVVIFLYGNISFSVYETFFKPFKIYLILCG